MSVIEVTRDVLRSMPIPAPGGRTDKDERGRVFVIAGSGLSPGASVLAGQAALRSGAGKVLAGVAQEFAVPLGLAQPEFGILAITPTTQGEPSAADFRSIERHLDACDAVLLGPGMVDGENAAALARRLLTVSDRATVLDAAAITGLRHDAGTVRSAKRLPFMTPHTGELAALMGVPREQIERHPAQSAVTAAAEFRAIIILKGPQTYIAHPDGELWRHSGGVPGLGTAGSGDVLAGVLTGLVARGTPASAACLWSVYLHARAGALLARHTGTLGFLARQLSEHIPHLLDESAGPPTAG